MRNKKKNTFNSVFWLGCTSLLVCIIAFLLTGTSDSKELSSILEKVATVIFSVAVGYGALVAAIAALASHNTSKDPSIKQAIYSFIYIIILYVMFNMVLFLISTFITPDYSPFLTRFLISLSVIALMAISAFLVKLTNKLIF